MTFDLAALMSKDSDFGLQRASDSPEESAQYILNRFDEYGYRLDTDEV